MSRCQAQARPSGGDMTSKSSEQHVDLKKADIAHHLKSSTTTTVAMKLYKQALHAKMSSKRQANKPLLSRLHVSWKEFPKSSVFVSWRSVFLCLWVKRPKCRDNKKVYLRKKNTHVHIDKVLFSFGSNNIKISWYNNTLATRPQYNIYWDTF